MTVIRELAAIARITIPHWRRDVALAAGSWLVMVAVLWVPFGH